MPNAAEESSADDTADAVVIDQALLDRAWFVRLQICRCLPMIETALLYVVVAFN